MTNLVLLLLSSILFFGCVNIVPAEGRAPLQISQQTQPFFLTGVTIFHPEQDGREVMQGMHLTFALPAVVPKQVINHTLSQDRRTLVLMFVNTNIPSTFTKRYAQKFFGDIIHSIEVDHEKATMSIEFNSQVEYRTYFVRPGVVGFLYISLAPLRLDI